MRSAELRLGRRWAIVLEPGEEVLEALTRWCAAEGVAQAIIPSLFGAFRSVTLIATTDPVDDEEPPLPKSIEVRYAEGSGSGSIALKDGVPKVHVHAAVGVKSAGGLAYSGHVLAAIAHYTVEIVVDEVLSPALVLEPRAESAGLDCLTFVR